MELIICEKKDLAEEIAEAIPGEKKREKNYITTQKYIICWAAGHLLRHKNPDEINEKYKTWNLEDLPIYFPKWQKTEIENKKYLLNTILKLLKEEKIKGIIHAGDLDDEGQYLIDEILEYANNKKPVKRLQINDGTVEAVKKSLSKMENNNNFINFGKAAKARSIADMLIGFNLSRFYSIVNKKKLTIGRVQTPTLALVVNRENEIKNHTKEKFFELYLKAKILNVELNLKNIVTEKIIDKNNYNWIEKIKNKEGRIKITKKKYYKENPLPFDLGSLQAMAEVLYKYSSQKTLNITQSLRDKYKSITYNRSEIKFLSDEHYKEAPRLVKFLSNKFRISANFNLYDKPRCFDTKKLEGNPHHAIIPTLQIFDINVLSEEEKNIYMLIVERYLIQFLEKIEIEKTEAEINIEDNIFKQSSIKIINLGYTKYFKEVKDEDNPEDENQLSKLSELPEGLYNILLNQNDFSILEKETKPKKHYTESSLLNDMRNIAKYIKDPEIKKILKEKDKGKDGVNGSIGTPATQGPIIASLFEKGYLKKIGRNVIATDLAIEYLKILPEDLKTADNTALWWSIQQDIIKGKADIQDLILKVLEDVKKIINDKNNKIVLNKIEEKTKITYGVCPRCKKGTIHSNEKAYYCTEYKNGCKFYLLKKLKIYGKKEIEITENKIKNLLSGKSILINKLENKEGKEYSGYFKLEFTDKFNNLVLDKLKK